MIEQQNAITTAKWASVISHIKNNRIEYLVLLGLFHLFGITNRVYSEVQGVCI